MSLTAIQKARQTLTDSPDGVPTWQHDGSDVVRWITGGSLPDLRVTFEIERTLPESKWVRCAVCKRLLGIIPADFNAPETAPVLAVMRAEHVCDLG